MIWLLTFQERIIRVKIRIQCITVFFRTRTSGKEYSPYSSPSKHQPSFEEKVFYSSQLRFSSLQPCFIFPPFVPVHSSLLSVDPRKWSMTYVIFLLPVPPEVTHGPFQEHHLPTVFQPSISFSSDDNSLLTKGFSFFSQSAVSASCHLCSPQASATPYVVIDPTFTLTY